MNLDLIKQILKRHEGIKLVPYLDSLGIKTIGVGWNMQANSLPDDIAQRLKVYEAITPEMAERLLTISLNNAIKNCQEIFPSFDTVGNNRQLALIDIVFNMGFKVRRLFPRFIHNVNIGDWQQAANELEFADGKSILSSYVKQVGKRAYENINLLVEG